MPVFNFPGHTKNCVVRNSLQLPQQVRKKPGALHDDLLQVAGQLASHGQQNVLVLTQSVGKFHDDLPGRRREYTSHQCKNLPLTGLSIRYGTPSQPGTRRRPPQPALAVAQRKVSRVQQARTRLGI